MLNDSPGKGCLALKRAVYRQQSSLQDMNQGLIQGQRILLLAIHIQMDQIVVQVTMRSTVEKALDKNGMITALQKSTQFVVDTLTFSYVDLESKCFIHKP